jgi:hypothetical protein
MPLRAGAIALSAVIALPALADVPPPRGYVERCTVARQQTATTECVACAANYMLPDRCQTMLTHYAYHQVCQTRGNSSAIQVFCRDKDVGAPRVPGCITHVLGSADIPPPLVPDSGVCPALAVWNREADVGSTPIAQGRTDTVTVTSETGAPAADWKQDESEARASTRKRYLLVLGPLAIGLAGMALVLRCRRTRRR